MKVTRRLGPETKRLVAILWKPSEESVPIWLARPKGIAELKLPGP